jgi:hypothetical protein
VEKIKSFIDRNPVRVAAFVSSTVALVATALFPEMPTEAAVAFVLSALGLGEFAQRKEDKKTEEALLTDPEDIEL